jgi:hypothetical protein
MVMGCWQWWHRAVTGTLTASAIAAVGFTAAPAASAATQVCTSATHPGLARKISRDMLASFRGRTSVAGVRVKDPALGISCSLNGYKHFYSASVVKVTILAALLRKADQQNRSLTAAERGYAWKMITESDNTAATRLWNDVGMYWLRHFLNLARMNHTVLGSNGYWGLTEITAHDESLLLGLLVKRNSVLTGANRSYELYLMSKVISSQRWGTPAGVPTSYRVHVKNGWLPVTGYGWFINSLGAFTRSNGRSYTMDVLTDHNSSMSYGVTTVEDIARAVNRDLASASGTAAAPAVPRSTPSATWNRPDETIPDRMTPSH